MKEPTRWVDDPGEAPTDLVALLRAAGPVQPLPDALRRRSEARVVELAARPPTRSTGRMAATTAIVGAIAFAGLLLAFLGDRAHGPTPDPRKTLARSIEPDLTPQAPSSDEAGAAPGPSAMSFSIDPSSRGTPRQVVRPPGSAVPLELSAAELSSAVSGQRRSLQRCYETAIRGMADPPTVRLDVSIRVRPDGTVRQVSVEGDDVRGLQACMRTTIQGWRFPTSQRGTRTIFPVVFSPQ